MSVKEVQLPFDVDLLPAKKMKAGSLSCFYEGGSLRYIKCGDKEILRMIYGALRDENWETIPPIISAKNIEEKENGFSIKYSATYKTEAIHYRADFLIAGNKDNSIVFSMRGEALTDFKKNRIGLCVLHPIKEYAARNVTITQPDGNIYNSVFPALISPHQPFLNIQRMNFSLVDGIDVQLNFEGDIFETEDQRNWTDSSYKTYSTPLHLPFPVLIKTGEKIEHRITLRVTGDVKREENKSTSTFREQKIPFPKVGYCRSATQRPLTNEQVKLFSQIPFDHYRVELLFDKSSWKDVLVTAVTEARLLKTKFELITFFDEDCEKFLDEFVLKLEPLKDIVSSILLLHKNNKTTPTELMRKGYAIIRQHFTEIKMGYGTDGYFSELNRNPPEQLPYDFVNFSLNPQVHASDNRTLFENLTNQADTIKTIKNVIGDKQIHVSPITLKMRKHSDTNLIARPLSHVADERQHTHFTAFWTLLCMQSLGEANHLTFYELIGETGIISEEKGSPVYDVLKMIKEFNGKWIIKRYENEDLIMESFLIENENGERMIFKCSVPVED